MSSSVRQRKEKEYSKNRKKEKKLKIIKIELGEHLPCAKHSFKCPLDG